jgi:hypothetical protein
MNGFTSIGLRVGFVLVALALWFWSQRAIARKPPPATGTVGDRLHAWTAPLHARLEAAPGAATALLIASSALIDLFGLYLLGGAIFGPTLQPFIALLIVFALRQACQATCTLPAPPGMIWRSPGFPSLLVTYGVSNDFFFSGHTAIAVLGALQLAQHAPPWLAAAGGAVALFEAATVIVLRAHYTMDVIAAVFAAWAADAWSRVIAPGVDAWLGRLG